MTKVIATKGISTKAQLALSRQREQQKVLRQQAQKQHKEAAASRQFLLRLQNKKEKHKGRWPLCFLLS